MKTKRNETKTHKFTFYQENDILIERIDSTISFEISYLNATWYNKNGMSSIASVEALKLLHVLRI